MKDNIEDEDCIMNIGVEVIVCDKSNISFKKLRESFELFLRETPNKQQDITTSLLKLKSLERTLTFLDYPDRNIVDYYKVILLGLTSANINNQFLNFNFNHSSSPSSSSSTSSTTSSMSSTTSSTSSSTTSKSSKSSKSSQSPTPDNNSKNSDSNNVNNNSNNNIKNSNNNKNNNNNNNNNNNSTTITAIELLKLDKIKITKINYQIFIYKLSNDSPQSELIDEQESFSPYQQLLLPNKSFETLWENLIYEEGLKSNLLSYMSTLILFSRLKIDSNICSNNKVIFLYGPPGTGKTSLAKALAQKISILYKDKFSYTQLIEINTHSLFSKWFSESGKLVMRMFENIKEILEDQNCFVMILIDEVESLAAARNASIESGTEPSDSIRVVNAFLTQLDQLKAFSNVLVVATSNITKAVDLAFIDRADIKQYIGTPSVGARKYILQTIYNELSLKGVLSDYDFNSPNDDQLDRVAENTDKYSGRSLRKLPSIAISSHISFTSLPIPSLKFTNILLNYINQTNISNNKLLN